jgi:hypothetical protein
MAITISADSAEGGTAVSVTITASVLGNLRVERLAAGSSVKDVILPSTQFIGSITYTDRTAPFDVNLTYTAIHSVEGTVNDVVAARVFPTDESVCYPCVLSDPTEEGLMQPATLQIYRPFAYAARSSVNDIIGQRYPVVLGGVRGPAGGTITAITHTANQAANFRAILASGRTLVFRVPSTARPEAPSAAIAINGVNEEPVILSDISRPERKWTMEFIEVAVPSISDLIDVGGNNWADIDGCYATWGDLTADPEAYSWQVVKYSPNVGTCP